jgi:hypothetical protein
MVGCAVGGTIYKTDTFCASPHYDSRLADALCGVAWVEQHRKTLAEDGVTVVAHITKDRDLVAWAKCTDRRHTSAGISADGAGQAGATRLGLKLTRRRKTRPRSWTIQPLLLVILISAEIIEALAEPVPPVPKLAY